MMPGKGGLNVNKGKVRCLLVFMDSRYEGTALCIQSNRQPSLGSKEVYYTDILLM